jgi:hypothetical protein
MPESLSLREEITRLYLMKTRFFSAFRVRDVSFKQYERAHKFGGLTENTEYTSSALPPGNIKWYWVDSTTLASPHAKHEIE